MDRSEFERLKEPGRTDDDGKDRIYQHMAHNEHQPSLTADEVQAMIDRAVSTERAMRDSIAWSAAQQLRREIVAEMQAWMLEQRDATYNEGAEAAYKSVIEMVQRIERERSDESD